MTVKERLIEFIKYMNLSHKRFEERVGLANGYVNNIRQSVSQDKLQKISLTFPKLNKAWLLTGEGNMLNDDNNDTDIKPKKSIDSGRPYYDVDFLGGYNEFMDAPATKPDYLIDFRPFNREGITWCNITGHSMEPVIHNGDMIALKEVQEWWEYVTYGEIYGVVTRNNMRTIKYIRKGHDDDHFLLVPANTTDYDIQEIKKTDIVRIFHVECCVKKF